MGVHTNICRAVRWKAGKASGVVFHRAILLSGAGACSCVSPHTKPDSPGHAADRGGADPDRAEDRPHPAPAQGSLRPRQRRLREEDPRVSPEGKGCGSCLALGCCPGKPDLVILGFALFSGTVI